MDPDEFEVQVYDADLSNREWVTRPLLLSATPRHCEQPTAALTLSASNDMVGRLSAPGTRVVIYYRDEYLMGGPVRLRSSEGAGPGTTRTFQIRDDFRILTDLLGWQVPGAAITAQSAAEFDVRTGPAETVLKGFLTANLARISSALPCPVTIATDLGRGDTITVQARMQRLSDRLFPLVDQAGIGVTVKQTLTGLVVDCYEPTDWPLQLDEGSGTVVSNEWTLTPPAVTRVVVGFDGDGTARVFRQYVNTAAETQYGVVIEDFVDARDIKSTDPDFATLASARGAEALAAGAATAGLAVKLAETDTFRYGGDGVHVGDRVSIELTPGTVVTDVLRSATLTWSRDAGKTVTPVIGQHDNDPTDSLVRAVADLSRSLRNTQAGG